MNTFERLIDECPGRRVDFDVECPIPENIICDDDFHRFCPRGLYPSWREVCLRKAAE